LIDSHTLVCTLAGRVSAITARRGSSRWTSAGLPQKDPATLELEFRPILSRDFGRFTVDIVHSLDFVDGPRLPGHGGAGEREQGTRFSTVTESATPVERCSEV